MNDPVASALRRARADPAAFTAVYSAEVHRVLAFLTRRTFDVEVARDLTAETFATAFEHRRRFRGTSDPEAVAWLFGIARHQLSRYLRRGVVQQKAVTRLGISVPEIADDDYERVIKLAGLADLRGRVALACEDLPAEQARALRLRVVEERSYEDVASTLGVSEQTARSRVSRGLRRLAELLDMTTAKEASS